MIRSKRGKTVFLFIFLSLFIVPMAYSISIEITVTKEVNLDAAPLDVATSNNGSMLFILSHGEILIYETDEAGQDKLLARHGVEKGYDGIVYSDKLNELILTSSSSKKLTVLQIDKIFNISLSGSPIKGDENALVTIAVFDDYQ